MISNLSVSKRLFSGEWVIEDEWFCPIIFFVRCEFLLFLSSLFITSFIQLFIDVKIVIRFFNLDFFTSKVSINLCQLFESLYKLRIIRLLRLVFENIWVQTWWGFSVKISIVMNGKGWDLMNFCKLHIFGVWYII